MCVVAVLIVSSAARCLHACVFVCMRRRPAQQQQPHHTSHDAPIIHNTTYTDTTRQVRACVQPANTDTCMQAKQIIVQPAGEV